MIEPMLPSASRGRGFDPVMRAVRVCSVVAVLSVLAFGIARMVDPTPAGFADAVNRVKPGVVNILATYYASPKDAATDILVQDLPPVPFDRFIRHLDQGDVAGRPVVAHRLGSGFIVDPTGYIVTNDHVIDGATQLLITLQDGRKFAARIVGRDPATDLALLKIEAKVPLPFVAWGDSDTARVGDWVFAIGSPFGLGGTVTAGILSARGREIESKPYNDYLQVDAPINRGNSGGPSFSRDGRVIGVNMGIYSPTGGSVGIALVIPATLAKAIVAQLRAHGHVDRGWLGLDVQPLTGDLADGLGLAAARGVLVAQVESGSPAEQAGVMQGDVVRVVDGKAVTRMRDYLEDVAAIAPGRTVAVGVWRDGKELSVRAKVGRRTGASVRPAVQLVSNPGDNLARGPLIGVKFAGIDRLVRRQYGLPESAHGVLVTEVQRGSPASAAGFLAGDIVVKVRQRLVNTSRDLVTSVRDASQGSRRAVLFLIRRDDSERFLAVSLHGEHAS